MQIFKYMKQLLLSLQLLIVLASNAALSSSFSCNTLKGCSPLVVNLTDHSSGTIVTRTWDFGNGNVSTQINPSATYLNPGTYTVRLIVSDGTHTDTSSQQITVFQLPTVNFTCDTTTTCFGDSIHFRNLVTAGSAPVNHFAWGFGNGIASSDTNAIYMYSAPGTFNVTLVVQDTNGCDGHLTKPAYITIWPKPVAQYSVTPQVSCGTSQTLSFSNQSTGTGLTYAWSFGDSGAISHTPSPAHLYPYGIYPALLTATNNFGCKSKFQQTVSIINVVANFMANKTTVCAGETVYFYDLSPMPGTSWRWYFGDGTISGNRNPLKVYRTPGVYSVTFVVKDQMCLDSVTVVGYMTVTQGFSVSFMADNRNSCNTPFTVNFRDSVPAGVSLLWTFGNGTISTDTNPTVTYTTPGAFTVSLVAVDSTGCMVTVGQPGYINTTKPDVNFVCDTLICTGDGVQFNNRTVNAVRYLWNFGDGDTSTALNPLHHYTGYGRYTVSLTAWDSLGCDSTLVKAGLIRSDSVAVSFTVNSRFSMCPPLVSVFRSSVNRQDLKYLWNFGDGYTDTARNPTHIFFTPGVYTVSVRATSIMGCSGTFTDSALITVQGPTGNFTVSPVSGCAPLNVAYSGSVSNNTASIVCDLGDGTLYTDSLNFNYTYNATRIYHPKFILTDYVGCTVPVILDSIITHSRPELQLRDTTVCAGRGVEVNLGSGSFRWNYNSTSYCDTCRKALSFCDTCSSLLLTPADTTTFVVTSTNSYGCSVTDSFVVNVDPLPVLSAQDTIRLCKGASTTINAVQQAYGVAWSPARFLNSASVAQPVCTPQQNIDYTVQAFNRMGCSVSETIAVAVVGRIPMIAGNDTSVCPGSQVNLYAALTDSALHGTTISWIPAPGLTETADGDAEVTMDATTESFTVVASGGSCTADTINIKVTVNAAATVTLPASLSTTAGLELPITIQSGDLSSYNWQARETLSCTECPNPVLTATESQMVYLSGTNQFGCKVQDSVLVNVLQCDPATVFVPNTFTPNNDGLDDILYVRSKTLSQLDYFRVFDRWGSIVFESHSLSQGWDGTINGKTAEQGVYVYQYSGKCPAGADITRSGTVTLLR